MLKDPQYDSAGQLQIKVTVFLNILLLLTSLLFIGSYVLSGQYGLIPYVLVPFVLPSLACWWLLKCSPTYGSIVLFIAYLFTVLGLMKLLSEPGYLVDLFLLPVYIGVAFLALRYRDALIAVGYLLVLFIAAALVVHFYQPFDVVYSNSNLSSLEVGYFCCIATSIVLFYTFARQYQRNSELLGDTMLALQKMNDDNKLMLNVISHDFRNYLVRVLMQVELGRSASATAQQHQIFDNLEASLMKLSDLLTEVQNVRELFSGAQKKELAELPVREILKKVEMIFRHQLYMKRITLDTSACEDLLVTVNPDVFIHVILGNLVGNAVKFSPKNSVISVSAWRDGGLPRLCIVNRATAGQDDNLRRIAGGSERLQSLPGTANETGQGLGIGIVRRFCRANGIGFVLDASAREDGLLEVRAVLAFG